LLKQVKRFFAHDSGNIALTFAISFLPIMLSIGAAIDYSRASDLHSRVANATDAALLAAVTSVMTDVDLDDPVAVKARLNAEFEPFFLANLHGEAAYTYNGFTINFDPVTKDVTVDVDIDYKTAIFGIVGMSHWEADVRAATGMQMKAGGAISMFMVLDRSGSMGLSNGDGGTKMESLKTAVSKMISNFETADPNSEFIRMGAVAYSSSMWSKQKLNWKLSKTTAYVNAMSASGGTDSSDSVNEAYKQLKKNKELNFHKKKSGQTPDLIMLFMTDGDNNYSSDDASTKSTCDKAKAYGIEVYTVAFQAPNSGQALLEYCATSSAHYFEPTNTDELIASFNSIGKDVSENLVLSH
jgi:uncharacterized protein YegL